MVRMYRRSMAQVDATVQLIEVQANMDLLYFDGNHPRVIAFAARAGS